MEGGTSANGLKYTWITQVTYIPAIILAKVAILLFFLRIFGGGTFRKICIGTIIYCILFLVSTFIAAILACVPVEAAWTAWAGPSGALCYDNSAFWWAHSVRKPSHSLKAETMISDHV